MKKKISNVVVIIGVGLIISTAAVVSAVSWVGYFLFQQMFLLSGEFLLNVIEESGLLDDLDEYEEDDTGIIEAVSIDEQPSLSAEDMPIASKQMKDAATFDSSDVEPLTGLDWNTYNAVGIYVTDGVQEKEVARAA